MIRFLFVVLSVVAAVLAYLFEMRWLYAVAAVLLVIAGVLVIVDVRRRYREETQPYSTAAPRPDEPATKEELLRHGILEVRRKNAPEGTRIGEAAALAILSERHHSSEEEHRRFAPTLSDAAGDDLETEGIVEPAKPVGTIEAKPRVTPVYSRPAPEALGSNLEAALRPLLTAFQATVGAYTVCLFRIDRQAERYRLDSIVSRDPEVVSERSFRFKDYFLSRVLPEPTLLDLPQEKLTVKDLRYYRETPDIGQIAIIPVVDGKVFHAFLVADRLRMHGAFTQEACDVLAEAGQLLALMYRLPDTEAASPAPVTDPGPRLRLVEVGRQVTQREIIAEEMKRARTEERALALALVYLYGDVDAFAARENRSVEETEENVLQQLRKLTPSGRVERFGEMGFGVFHYGEVNDITDWVKQAHEAVNAYHSPEEGQISIGVAMLSDRHQNPDDLQVDAARALRAAYESGESTILVK